MQKRLQNKIAESRLTLPFACVYGLAMWLFGGLLEGGVWVSFVCFAVSTYLMVELNNRNALLRIYSRMVSVSFITMSMMLPFMMSSVREAFASMGFLFSLFILLFSYQDRQSMGKTFYAFAFLSSGSIFDIHLLYYIPLLWVAMTFYLQTISWRNFFASILGVIVPYWFAAISLFFIDDPMVVVSHFANLVDIPLPPDYSQISIGAIVATAWIVLLVLVGSVHFARNSFMDSIRIRMIFNTFTFLALLTTLFLVAIPASFDMFVRVLIVVASPLIAHFISLTHTRLTNIAFIAIMIVTFAITIFNLWIHLSPSL